MEHKKLRARFLDPADGYVKNLAPEQQIRIAADVTLLSERRIESVRTRQLRGPIRELIAGSHRITYFVLEESIYFVRGFRKKTNKTPRQEIEYAEEIYKKLSK